MTGHGWRKGIAVERLANCSVGLGSADSLSDSAISTDTTLGDLGGG